MKITFFLLLICLSLSCQERRAEKANASDFALPEKVAEITDKRLVEASGLVASVNNKGFLWTHNDSGNPAEVFLIDEKASVRLVCTLQNASNRDWEDIAVGPGPRPGRTYIYVGDIGDNLAQYPYKIIYRFEEPSLTATDTGREKIIRDYQTIVFRLEDKVKDTETLMIHPRTKNLYIVSKREEPVVIYELPFPDRRSDTLIARSVATIPLTQIVAGDFSPEGDEILLKNYQNVYYWRIGEDESVAEAFKNPPKILPYNEEPQGEAIAFSRDGMSFYTISEKVNDERSYLSVSRRR